ncbi:MAG: transcriptional regulator, HxlR family [Promethearchaeota archaeon CR_4]|nr:MAG: transcriptional regulator, HxlR family [Candidatus Lokiarchaeota archaeon CR_4]
MVQTPSQAKKRDQPQDTSQETPLHWHCVKHSNAATCDSDCSFHELLGLFSKTHALPIVRQLLLTEKLRFNELLEKVGGSPKTLTSRLRDLEQFGLITRAVFNEVPIRVEYSLTTPGKELEDLFERMAIWIRKWRTKSSQ